MEIKIEVKANAARDKLLTKNGKIIVQTKQPDKNNLANQGVIDILSKHFAVGEDKIKIIKGFKSKNKIVEVKNENNLA